MPYVSGDLSGPHGAPRGKYGNGEWWYDTTDGFATIEGAGYISDARARGVLPGDIIFVTIWNTMPNPVTPLGATATPLTGTGSIVNVGQYRVRGITTAGAAVVTNELTQTLAAS